MQLDKLFIGLLLGAFFMIGSFTILGSMINVYNSNIDITEGDMGRMYNYSTRIQSNLSTNYEDTKDKTLFSDISGSDEPEQSLIKGAYNSIKSVPATARLAAEGIGIMGTALGIPNFVVVTAVSMLFIAMLFAIVYLIFKFKG